MGTSKQQTSSKADKHQDTQGTTEKQPNSKPVIKSDTTIDETSGHVERSVAIQDTTAIKKHAGGRPLKFTPEELSIKCDAYFEENKEPTVTDLCLYLDTTRETLCEYSARPEFTDIIKKAKDRIIVKYERGVAFTGKGMHSVGSMFILKNMDPEHYKDRHEINTVLNIDDDLCNLLQQVQPKNITQNTPTQPVETIEATLENLT